MALFEGKVDKFVLVMDKLNRIECLVQELKHEQRRLMSQVDERLSAVETAVNEAADEILAELSKLRSESLTEAGLATLGRLETKAEALRNISPPVPPPEPPPGPEAPVA